MNFQESETFALDHHKNISKVAKLFSLEILPLWNKHFLSPSIDILVPQHRRIVMDGLIHRLIAWLHSLQKLNHGEDIQPIVTSVRAILELVIDLILIYYDKTNESGWKIINWGDSAKLKSAKAVVSYFETRAKTVVPDEYEGMKEFIAAREPIIKHMRRQLGWVDKHDFNKDKHPERWTNRGSLLDDVREADNFHGSKIENHFGSNLEQFYETEYRRLNWNIHGSGIIGIQNVDEVGINLIRAFGYRWSVKLSLICVDIILSELKDKGIIGENNHLISELEYISVNIH